jgi:hypothetical protein
MDFTLFEEIFKFYNCRVNANEDPNPQLHMILYMLYFKFDFFIMK